jgi:hypothetical protein
MTLIMALMVMEQSNHARAPRGRSRVLVEVNATLELKRVRPFDRLRARACTSRLDRELASGTSPESSVILALHAARLYRVPQRRVLAVGLRKLIAAAQSPLRTPTPISRDAVRQSEPELEEIATRLESTDPIDVCGVARVRQLLTDGGSPFYVQAKPDHLKQELRTTLSALDATI